MTEVRTMTGTVKALDLANVIRDAFLAGAGMDTASKKIERIPDELLERLSSYNPEHVPAFGRLKSLHLSALTTAPATTGLVYRPNKYDDWGMIRNADGSLFAVVRRPLSEEEAAQHRENKTDPFESLARTLMSALTASASEPEPVAADAFPVATLDHLSDGAAAVIKERLRQVYGEGWTPEHDDQHSQGEMATAAGCYLLHQSHLGSELDLFWPWEMSWWKPGDRRRELVKAGALIIAEIERLDRESAREKSNG